MILSTDLDDRAVQHSIKVITAMIAMVTTCSLGQERDFSEGPLNSTDFCCRTVHTHYKRDFIYQLANLDLKDFADVIFRCSHRVCSLDHVTSFGVMYFGRTDAVTVSMASCDDVKEIQAVENPQTSRQYHLDGPCLCLEINISGQNMSSFYGASENGSVIVLASFYANDNETSDDVTPDVSENSNGVVDVAYTCSASEKSLVPAGFQEDNLTIPSSSPMITGDLSPSLNLAENATAGDNSTLNTTTESKDTVTMIIETTAQSNKNQKLPAATHYNSSRCETCGGRTEQASPLDVNLLGWMVAVGVCGVVIVMLLVFSAFIYTHYFRYLKSNAKQHVRRRQVVISPLTTALGLDGGAYQNEVFSGGRRHNQSSPATQDAQTSLSLTTFRGDQSNLSTANHMTSRLAPNELYTVDMNRPNVGDVRVVAGNTNVSSSPECLDLDGSDFSDDDFFFDDFDDLYPNESVI